MTIKYGYTITQNGQTTIEVWGYENLEQVMTDFYNLPIRFRSAIDQVAIYETTHRNYFGKQFKQVSCKRIN